MVAEYVVFVPEARISPGLSGCMHVLPRDIATSGAVNSSSRTIIYSCQIITDKYDNIMYNNVDRCGLGHLIGARKVLPVVTLAARAGKLDWVCQHGCLYINL